MNAKILTWTTHAYDKLVASRKEPEVLNKAYTVYMAKAEFEGFQIAVRSDADTALSLEKVSGEGIRYSVYTTERTHTIRGEEYADSLIPYGGGEVNARAGITLTFFVEFATVKDTGAGDYTYEFAVKNGGETVDTVSVTVHVWNFAIPETKTFGTACGINGGQLGRFGEDYGEHYELFADHFMSPYDLPCDILSDDADKYMSDPRITSFIVPTCENDDAKLAEYYEKVKSNPDWFRKAMLYPLDEPRSMEHLAQYKAVCERFFRVCPGLEPIAPFYTNIQAGERMDQFAHMAPHTNLWCPKLNLWEDKASYATLDYTPDEHMEDRIAAEKAKGKRLWTYVCNDPILPYSQLYIDTPGLIQRALFWQMYQRDCEGFLYWGVTAWGSIDPWVNTNNGVPDGQGKPLYGCGFLCYPSKVVGASAPVGSLRLKICRDGVEDMELFYMAEKIIGREALVDITKKFTPDLTTYALDCDGFYALRKEIAEIVEKA